MVLTLITYLALVGVITSRHMMDPLLEPNRKKGSKYQLKFYKEPQVIKRKHHSYVKYISTPLGGVSATQSSIQTTVIAESEDNAMPVIAEPDECSNFFDADGNEPTLDLAYQDHISGEVPDEHLKRDRPKGVSRVSPKVCVILKS